MDKEGGGRGHRQGGEPRAEIAPSPGPSPLLRKRAAQEAAEESSEAAVVAPGRAPAGHAPDLVSVLQKFWIVQITHVYVYLMAHKDAAARLSGLEARRTSLCLESSPGNCNKTREVSALALV